MSIPDWSPAEAIDIITQCKLCINSCEQLMAKAYHVIDEQEKRLISEQGKQKKAELRIVREG